MPATLQAVFEQSFDEYARSRCLPMHLHKAARSIRQCRTAALGGHVLGCSEGHVAGIWYNSCRHRSCPQCGSIAVDQWLDAQKERLLSCDHYHVIFTIPHELNFLWYSNRSLLTDLLYRCARETLFELLGDEKYLGAQPGVIAALHTWGRTLSFHPHLHCLVTGGGWAESGWRPVGGGFLLPFQVVRALFRGKFLSSLQQALSEDRLVLPETDPVVSVQRMLRKLWKKKWNVRVTERYPHGAGVVAYLARYLRGGPLPNRRLVTVTPDRVTFGYTDPRDGRQKTMTLSSEDLIRRILWHVPEPGSHAVRYWGLYARTKEETRAACRLALGQAPFEAPEVLSAAEHCERRGWCVERRCEECGRPLILLEKVSRGFARSPPVRRAA